MKQHYDTPEEFAADVAKKIALKPTRELTATQAWFFAHAGYGYNPLTETAAQGKTRCAIEYAAAEDFYIAAHREGNAETRVEFDAESSEEDGGARFGIRVFIHGNEASLWGIDGVCMDGYGRVVRAELALELMP
jgi:hypothetical protein